MPHKTCEFYFCQLIQVNETATIGIQVTGHPTPVLKWYHQRCCLNDTLVDISVNFSFRSIRLMAYTGVNSIKIGLN